MTRRVTGPLLRSLGSKTLRQYGALLSILWLALTTLAQEGWLREGITRAARNAVAATETMRPFALLELIDKYRLDFLPGPMVEVFAGLGPVGALIILPVLVVSGGLRHAHEAGWWVLVPLAASVSCGVIAARTVGRFLIVRFGSLPAAVTGTLAGGILGGGAVSYLIYLIIWALLHTLGLIAAFVGYIGVGVLTIDKGLDLWKKIRTVRDAAKSR